MDQGIHCAMLPTLLIPDLLAGKRMEKTIYVSSFPSLQIWSMDSDKPVHSLQVDLPCMCLTWYPKQTYTHCFATFAW